MDQPIVTTKNGKLKGLTGQNLDGDTILKFLGIPYAQPPVGNLRFKEAKPISSWEGVKEAVNEGDVSVQAGILPDTVVGSEDCLTLNVFTKKVSTSETKLSPVMVWIHAGGYKSGSKSIVEHGPEYLLLEDVVLVCINYRLGILGFLNLQDPSLDVPGNAGLKDQVLALKWIQNNIACFNGDPNNVTIFGNSAGGSSVELLLHSPLAKGLFQNVIIQSGSILNPWISGDFNVLDFMKFIGKPCRTESEALDILLKTSEKNLCKYQTQYCKLSGRPFGLGIFGVVLERPHERAFITKTPVETLTQKVYSKVPIMIGHVANEGLLFKACETFESYKQPFPDDFFDIFVPNQIMDTKIRREVGDKLKQFYFKDDNLLEKYELSGDAWFIMGVLASAHHYIKNKQKDVYLYRVSLDAGLNGFKKRFGLNLPGTCHGDDVGYIFKQAIPNLKIGEFELTCVRRMVKLWTNFAKYGNPTPNVNDLNIIWKPADEHLCYLDINTELVVQSEPKKNALKLWKDIYDLSEITKQYLN